MKVGAGGNGTGFQAAGRGGGQVEVGARFKASCAPCADARDHMLKLPELKCPSQ